MKTYGGYITKGAQKQSFEISTPNMLVAYDKMKAAHPDWDVHISDSHNSVYRGILNHSRLCKHK
jgi:hypothetical protein